MSDTPRTEAESRDFPVVIDRRNETHWCVRKEFAEKLERELAQQARLASASCEECARKSEVWCEPCTRNPKAIAKNDNWMPRTSNPRADRAAHLVRGTVEPVVGGPND